MDEIEYLGTTSTIQSYNLFTYCEGNPVNMVDESGTWPKWLDKLVGAAVALASSVVVAVTAVVTTVSTTAQAVIDTVVVPSALTVCVTVVTYEIFKEVIDGISSATPQMPNLNSEFMNCVPEMARDRYDVIRIQYDLMPYS